MEENISEALIVLNRNASFLQSQVGAVLWSLVLLSLLQTAGLSSCCVLAQPRAEEIKAGMGSWPANPAQPQAEPGSALLKVRYFSDSSNAPGSQHARMGDQEAAASLPHCLGVSFTAWTSPVLRIPVWYHHILHLDYWNWQCSACQLCQWIYWASALLTTLCYSELQFFPLAQRCFCFFHAHFIGGPLCSSSFICLHIPWNITLCQAQNIHISGTDVVFQWHCGPSAAPTTCASYVRLMHLFPSNHFLT